NTVPLPTMPSAIPNRNKTSRNGTIQIPYVRNDRPKNHVAITSITTSPMVLVQMDESTSPPTYSTIEIGVAKMFRKLRDHTSSKNAMVTPLITRLKKSHSRTAPNSTGTKSIRV